MVQNRFMFPNVAYRLTANRSGFLSNLILYILPYSDPDTMLMFKDTDYGRGINQRNLKLWADVAHKIGFDLT